MNFKYIFTKTTSIVLYMIIGFLLWILDDHVSYPWQDIYKAIIILGFITVLFWKQKKLAIILCLTIGLSFWVIDYYEMQEWNHIYRAALILSLLIFAFFMNNKNHSFSQS